MSSANDQYKDRLFSFIYGHENNKAWTLSLYNAVNGSSYTDPDAIEITTIKQVLYLGMHNDVSFLISDEMPLYEEQSTYNPNMPLRMMQYTGNLYEKYIRENKLNKYGSTLLQLPVPKLVTFYIGRKEIPDEVVLRLSDSFPEGSDPDIEAKVRVLSINPGRNPKLLEACQSLREYSWLMDRIRINRDTMELEDAVDQAIRDVPEDFILKPFLITHQAEVKGMLLTEYDEVEQMELFKEDGRKEGRIEGRIEGRAEGTIQTLVDLVKKGLLSIKDAAAQAKMTEDAFTTKMNVL